MRGQMCFKGWAVILIPASLNRVHDEAVRKKPLHVLGWNRRVTSANVRDD